MSDIIRRIDKALAERGISREAASKEAGLAKDFIRDIERKNSSPSIKNLQALAPVLKKSPGWLAFGEGDEELIAAATPRRVPVFGQVAAGLWFEDDGHFFDQPEHDAIPGVAGRYASLEQRAWRVNGDSMNEEGIVEGSFAISVDYWQVRDAVQDRDVVVVERRQGGKTERTIKKVSIHPNEIRLMACSTNPRWRGTSIIVPRNRQATDDGTEVEVVGLVIGNYRPFP